MTTDGARILVVDDNEDNRYTLTRRLRRQGHEDIVAAENGRRALEVLRSQAVDLVLLDIMMPEIDGYEVLGQLKSDPALRDVPVIMISAIGELDSVVRCIELGAEDYLPKPFNPVLLRARIGACLEKKRLHDQEIAYRQEIERQRTRADELLHAILPAPAVAELKDTGHVRPRRFEGVAILYCDIVRFTDYCDTHAPEEVVANLQQLVETAEELTAVHGLEKIDTVGDAIVSAAGLLEPLDDPVMASLRCAFGMLEAARNNPARWRLRAGIHIGPVVAGVIGREKFSFDIWGDTVNVAARLADLGEEAAVHLSADAWAAVADRCDGTSLGATPIKGKGSIDVYRCDAVRARA